MAAPVFFILVVVCVHEVPLLQGSDFFLQAVDPSQIHVWIKAGMPRHPGFDAI
jgi:hypothetical protein